MANPLDDIDFQEFIEGDIEIAGRKIPKIAVIGGGAVIIILLVLMGRSKGSGSSPLSSASRATGEPSDDGTGAIDGSSSDILAGVQQQISDSESNTATTLGEQITQTQSMLEEQFSSQLSDIYSQLGNIQQFSPEPSYLPVDSGFSGQQQYEPSYYDYAGVGGYEPPLLDSYGGSSSSQSPTINNKSVFNTNKALTNAPSIQSPTIKPSLGVVTNFGSIGAGLLSNQIGKVLNKPQPIKPSATVSTKPGSSILSGSLTSFLSSSKPILNAKPVGSSGSGGIVSGLSAALGIKPTSKPASVPKPVATAKPFVSITKPPPVYNPRPVAPPPKPVKPASIGGSLLAGINKPKPKPATNPFMKPNR